MEFASERRSTTADSEAGGDNFSVEDLLDLSNDDGNLESFTGDSSSPVAGVVDSCNSNTTATSESCFSAGAGEIGCLAVSDSHIPDDLCIPCDDVAELEWLSNFVEEDSFSKEDLHKLHLISGLVTSSTSGPIQARPGPVSLHSDADQFASSATTTNHPIFNAEVSIPAKARSKRARVIPCNWATQLLALSPNTQLTSSEPEKSLSQNLIPRSVHGPGPRPKKRKGGGEAVIEANGMVRRCLHCDTDRTPQWRTGPKGPKTLCNACGVRYKSGRLVPEYRPAASPTFVQAKHSSSHRKVMELRRQKEAVIMSQQMQSIHHRQQRAMPPEFIHNRMILDVPNPDEYLIHQRVMPNFN